MKFVDAFAGGGSTLLTARELGRRYIGIEANAEAVDMIEDRLTKESLL